MHSDKIIKYQVVMELRNFGVWCSHISEFGS